MIGCAMCSTMRRLDNQARPRRLWMRRMPGSVGALAGVYALIYLLYALLAQWNFYFGGSIAAKHGADLRGVPASTCTGRSGTRN
jgi:hypothetical protein